MNKALRRRSFLGLVGAAPLAGSSLAAPARIALLADPDDSAANAPPIGWAAEKLAAALVARGHKLETVRDLEAAKDAAAIVVLGGPRSKLAAGFAPPSPRWASPDCLRLVPGEVGGQTALLLSAIDARGFVYGLLELAERFDFGGPAALHLDAAVEDSSPNSVRSVARAFLSEIEDKSWYYDRDFWRDYLDTLTACRFNRFNFALGFGYDFPRGVTGDYLHFPYPYLLEVPGYDVKIAPALAAGEREKNLDTLRFIARETGARGLDFQLGLWTHAYQWTDSPHADHSITGLTPDTHAAYCRDALAMLLKQCPEITGVTLRVHGESGIPEGSYLFWQTLFEAIAGAGRKVEIDMHAKGINQIMIDMAAKTGQPVKIAPKYAAEHQSLGYHQADIRELEIPTPERMETGVFSVSNGERRFTRYGYADLFQEGHGYDVLFRLWPGTQRHLLSGDPALAAALGRSAHFCGAAGLEFCEPLTFKGREGSGHPGGRNAYARRGLDTRQDWRKFEDSYRLWGRLLYDPQASPESWRRSLAAKYGKGAAVAERALAASSRCLPLLTSAHLPSASNHSLWFEMYTNQPIVPGGTFVPYSDTPEPRIFANVSPLDPQLFSTIAEHAGDLLAGRANPKYSPAEVAGWLDDFSGESERAIAAASAARGGLAALARLTEDVAIQNSLARFFAAKLRSGVLFALWQQSRDAEAGRRALEQYQRARDAWAVMAERARGVYAADVAYGDIAQRHGHWTDRLPAIDADLAAMRAAIGTGGAGSSVSHAVLAVSAPSPRPAMPCRHTAPDRFRPGTGLALNLAVTGADAAQLYFRHVNHGERWRSAVMTRSADGFAAAIPADYTASPYPLQYYFVLERQGRAWFFPAFNRTLSNQPYYAVWQRV